MFADNSRKMCIFAVFSLYLIMFHYLDLFSYE